jgi:CubicO group peptidase (beta-lactamase class C family)
MTKLLDVEAIKARLSELLWEYRFPSASIGVLCDGEITDFAVGLKDISRNEAATTDTIYACASMTKTWTALAFMQLVDEGKVALDEPVQSYIPGFNVADPEVSATVTPRHLLNHTHGIEEDFGDPGEGDDVYERMVENIRTAPQVHPLGATHAYSPALGYAILGRIMELADGKRWDALMQDRLFSPLGLTSTSSRRDQVDQDRAVTPYLMRSLEEGPIESPMPYLPRAYGPGGNITSTPREVLAMASVFLNEGKALNGRPIVSAGAIRVMTESRVPLPDPYMLGSEWALGLTVHHWNGETVYGHDGGLSGQQSRLRILPDSNLAITMLATGVPRDSFYRKLFNTILAELGAVTIPDLPGPDLSLKLDVSRYEGAYARPSTRYEVEADDGKLSLTWVLDPMVAEFLGKPDRVRYDLLPIDETHFLMPPADPLEDTWTVALYDFDHGAAQYLHTVARGFPRVGT